MGSREHVHELQERFEVAHDRALRSGRHADQLKAMLALYRYDTAWNAYQWAVRHASRPV